VFSLFFLDAHQVRIDRVHELAEILVRTNLRFDDGPFDIAADIVERDKVRRVHHRECDRVVHISDGHDFVEQTQRLRQQADNARVEFPLEQVDVLDANLLGGVFQTLCQNPRQA